ncbi:MAG TPA: PPOX class F420-dependent oxidoreductase [Mycobacteriales bacterium]|nr:PPOX class F420-dependent oxidoreductase [Mycobacteriales bacterium]
MPVPLSDHVRSLIAAKPYVTLATLNRDGSPQLTVVWADHDGDQVLISTQAGRQKERNLRRDPRATLIVPNAQNPYDYAEIRGRVTMSTEGGRELIDALSDRYRGRPYDTEPEGTVRVVIRLTPERIVEFGV